MYRKAVDGQSPAAAAGCMVGGAGLLDRLVFDTNPSKLVYVAEMQVPDGLHSRSCSHQVLQGGSVIPKMDHLACFVPGLLALGAQHMDQANRGKHMKVHPAPPGCLCQLVLL